jgi:hypothetical protein
MMSSKINTHGLEVDFGKHKGTLYTRVPVGYLQWMVNSDHSRKEIAQAELDRRGTTMPTMDLSGHAIDRASQCLRGLWLSETNNGVDMGLHSWLHKFASEAYANGVDAEGVVRVGKVKLCFSVGDAYPVLMTVSKKKSRKRVKGYGCDKHDDDKDLRSDTGPGSIAER